MDVLNPLPMHARNDAVWIFPFELSAEIVGAQDEGAPFGKNPDWIFRLAPDNGLCAN
jgi:hypothetical protein